MKLLLLETFAIACFSILASPAFTQSQLTVEQVMAAPFSSDLVAAKSGTRIAWLINQQGKRNIWIAEAPAFAARQLTSYNNDDGAELSDLRFTADGEALLYVRGGGKNNSGEYANPTSDPVGQQQSIWQIAFRGGSPRKIDEGESPVASAHGKIAYVRAGQMWLASIQSEEKPLQIVVRGKNEPIAWSPDGQCLLFVSRRGDHSFIGIYDSAAPYVKYLSPTVDSDTDPAWSLDGKQVAFVRRPALQRDAPDGYFIVPDRPHPWAIWLANSVTTEAREIWHSGSDPDSSYPARAHEASGVLHFAAENHLVFPSEQDGWQHLYSLPVAGGTPQLLTPGNCEVEEWSFSADKKSILFNSNCGDIDRRHLWRVTLQGEPPAQMTTGNGIEWSPAFLADSSHFAYLGSNVREPGHPFTTESTTQQSVALNLPPFETWRNSSAPNEFVTPQPVIFDSTDGFKIHAQLFSPKNSKPSEKRPTLIFLHGGPMRQMLLGWHYMYYYAN
ncbi:MAG TPA: DPP IV N-terminal domain-containing protein, partial [Candidatus Acidoferrum sp.]